MLPFKVFGRLLTGFLCLFFVSSAVAQPTTLNCSRVYLLEHPHKVLNCAQSKLPLAPEGENLKLVSHQRYPNYEQQVYEYDSIHWPYVEGDGKKTSDITPNHWHQRLTIFTPKQAKIQDNTAVLYITGGTNYSAKTPKAASADHPLIRELVKKHRVIMLEYEPNQYLQINGKAQKEDAIVAYTWQKFVQNPQSSLYYPLHIPMTVVARQAMSIAQSLLQKQGVHITHFVVTGESKRAWTAWLTALADDRVTAVIPVVIDILNTTQQIAHIHDTYGQHWPIALMDYYAHQITEYANPHNRLHGNFLQLMQEEDPLTYLEDPYFYRKMANMPKYLINASGDDFFVPDASTLYYDQLLGHNNLLYLPNSSHYVDKLPQASAIAAQSVLAFYDRLLKGQVLPTLSWQLTDGVLKVRSSEMPIKATLWVAHNPVTRDMRLACGVAYQAKSLVAEKTLQVSIAKPGQGWQAAFVVLEYADHFTASTAIMITPDRFPKPDQIMPQQGACRLLDVPPSQKKG